MTYTLTHDEQADYDAGGMRLDAVRRKYREALRARSAAERQTWYVEVYDETATILLDYVEWDATEDDDETH